MKGLNWRAIGYGLVVSVLLPGLIVTAAVLALGLDSVQSSVMSNPLVRLAVTISGLALAVLGGFVAARRAGARPIAHGVGLGVAMVGLSLVLSALSLLLPATPTGLESPLWLAVLDWLLTVPAAALGGFIVARRPSPARVQPA